MTELIKIEEPELVFGHEQSMEDPRDGLTLFGPLKENAPHGINYGLVGTQAGVERFYRWLGKAFELLAHEMVSKRTLWIPFPGFETTFGIPLAKKAVITKIVNSNDLKQILREYDDYQRVYKIVNLYSEPILEFYKKADEAVNLWFVISPESVYEDCRPKSTIDDPLKVISRGALKKRKEMAKLKKKGQMFIFNEQEQDYYAYDFDNDFRRQLKARLILKEIKDPIQIIRESTLTPFDFRDQWGNPKRVLEPDSQVAWNLLSTTYYKAGGKPWKLKSIREGVCYLGMVFKKMDEGSACCAAQMFLDSGDGVVFKGAIGPWKIHEKEEYHLDYEAAKDIIDRAVSAYREFFGKENDPKEIFIHGRTYLNDEEWRGFSSIKDKGINIVGVRISHCRFKLFRPGKFPILRGTAYLETEKRGYLWSTGFIPRLRTFPYQGVPYPLMIEICQGEADLLTVLKDVLALTKLNYNSCKYSDGEPITIRFADKIGEILIAAPIEKDKAPLAFKYYI
jgi:hypothetical protein